MDKKKHDSKSEHSGDAVAEASQEMASAEDKVRELEAALVAKEEEARGNWDKFVRERADLENYRRRVQKEKEDLQKYGNEKLLEELLPVLDNMERALTHADGESLGAVIEGIRMTQGVLLSVLRKFGVTPVEASRGSQFDPAFHQAMTQVECADLEPNTVADEFQRGYLLNERLLRPAMVSVAVAPKK